MNIRYWRKESMSLSSMQDELKTLTDGNASGQAQLSAGEKLLKEGGSLEFGWVAGVCIFWEVQRRWSSNNPLAPLVPILKEAALAELKKELYAPPHSH